MDLDLMQYSKPEDNLDDDSFFGFAYFTLSLPAPKRILEKALAFEEGYSYIYGHQIFLNLNEIKEALEKATE